MSVICILVVKRNATDSWHNLNKYIINKKNNNKTNKTRPTDCLNQSFGGPF